MFAGLIAFYSHREKRLGRMLRTGVAALSTGGFAWASQFDGSPRLALAIKIATVAALLVVAAQDGGDGEAQP